MAIFTPLIFVFFSLLGCNETPGITKKLNEPTRERVSNDIAVFNIQSGFFLPEKFNRWNTLEKTKGHVHLFANGARGLELFSGVKHVVAQNSLAKGFSEALATVNPERLLIFLAGHGAETGKFCYEGKQSCHFAPNILVDALREYSKGRDLRLRGVLVIPGFCYNKLFMDQFAQLLKSYSWPFAISFISQKRYDVCSWQSPAESLFDNEILPYRKLTDKQLDEFLSLTTVEQLVDFQNALYHPRQRKELEYQVRYNQSPSPIKLSDFGFDMRIRQRLFDTNINVAGSPLNKMVFPNGRSVGAVLDELKLPNHVQSKAQALGFQMVESNSDGTPKNRVIDVNGNTAVIINEPDLQDKLVWVVDVILSQ